MRYLVYGTGAVGGYVGGRLALAGCEVLFLARPRVAEAMRSHGLRLEGDGTRSVVAKPRIALDLGTAFAEAAPDVVLLTVKAYDCQAAAVALANVPGGAPPVLSLLNGIDNEATLAALLGQDRVIAATLTTAVQMSEPGLVRVERKRGLGVVQGHPIVSALRQDMARAGLAPQLFRDARRMKWSKLLTNIVANATSAILGWPPDAVYRHPGLFRLELESLREAVRVMRRLGFAPQSLPGVPVGLLGRAIFLPAPITQPLLRRLVASGRGGKLPSFHYDIGRGRSEVGWLNGAVVRYGGKVGVPTPANQVLTQVLRRLVASEVRPEAYRGRPEVLLEQAARGGVKAVQGYNARQTEVER